MRNSDLTSLYDDTEPSFGNRTDYDSLLNDNKFHIQHVLGNPTVEGEDTARSIMQSCLRSTGYGYQSVIGNAVFAYRIWNGDDGVSAWKKIITDADIYGGELSGTVDFAAEKLFGPSGSIKVWQTLKIDTPMYAPKYYEYGTLICIHTKNLYTQFLISGSKNGAEYKKHALSLGGLKSSDWYEYTGTIANKS